jgi:hypothetical protein
MNCELCAAEDLRSLMKGDTVHGEWVCIRDDEHRVEMTEPERLRLMGTPTLL